MRKLILLARALMTVLVSCGPVTAVPSVTPIPSVTPTRGPVTASAFRLREMNEPELVSLINTYVAEEELGSALYKEALLKFPESKRRYELITNILKAEPETIVPGLPSDDPTGGMIAQLLDDGVQLHELQGKLEELGWYVDQTISIKNLIGNGEDAIILMIKAQWGSKMGVFAVLSDKGKYQVEKIRDWDTSDGPALGISFELFDVGDTNGNGISELVVQEWFFSGGFIQVGTELIDHFEWLPQDKKFQQTTHLLYSQSCRWDGGPCSGDWKFFREGSQSKLVTHGYWYTYDDCPNLTLQRISIWNGERYITERAEILPPNSDITPECSIAWAETAIHMSANFWGESLREPGWKNNLAISIIEQSLEGWPAKADEWWGPASRDFYKFQLGIWYELRGENAKSATLLEQVTTQPYNSKFDFLPRLASLYLQERSRSGAIKACADLSDAFIKELDQVVQPDISRSEFKRTEDNALMVKTLGVIVRRIEPCDIYEMFPAELENSRITSAEMLDEWLNTLAYPVYQSIFIDLNGDGIEDRLIFLDQVGDGYLDAWAFFMMPEGYIAKILDNGFSDGQAEGARIERMIVPLGQIEGLRAFLIPSRKTITMYLISPDLVIFYPLFQPSAESYKVMSEAQTLKIIVDIKNQNGQKTLELSWDGFANGVVEQNGLDVVLSQIEQVLYVDQDYPSVIKRVDVLLDNSNFDSDIPTLCGISAADDFCVDFPEKYAAYFLYMRALAYEQMGLVNDARDAYYQLWQKYPQNLFGIIASKKLEPIQP